MVAPTGRGGGWDRSRAGCSSVNPRWPQESAALLGGGATHDVY
jgi:hypothetical protein